MKMADIKTSSIATKDAQSTTLGVFETAYFPEFSDNIVSIKIDTGAYTGAMHATKIRVETINGNTKLEFAPFGGDKLVRVSDFRRSSVTSSNGSTATRYFIDTVIVLRGVRYNITISLADRGKMKYPVIIGRKFLRANNLVIDPNGQSQ